MLNKYKMKKISIIAVILVIAVVVVGFGAYKYNQMQQYNDLIATANKYMDSSEYDKAIALFNQSLTYKEDENIKSNIKLAEKLKGIKVIYDNGINLMNDKKYLEAIEQLNKITKEDNKLYNNAQKNINECKKQYIAQNIQLVNNEIKSNNYDVANKYIEEVLKLDSSNADAKKLKDDVGKLKEEQQKQANAEKEKSTPVNSSNSKAVTKEQAVEIVSNRIKNKGSKTVVDYDSTKNLNGSNYYMIHVYDNMGDHSATRGWYYVEINTGKAYKWDLVHNQIILID